MDIACSIEILDQRKLSTTKFLGRIGMLAIKLRLVLLFSQ